MVFPALDQKPIYLITYIIGIISIGLLILFTKILPKRTPYGNEVLGKIRGFKRFLEKTERSQLETLVNGDPEYFYNILPYIYALGGSETWMSQFETIALQAPNWYRGYSSFSIHEFNEFMNDTMKLALEIYKSGSSGGGSSGGGSGGGGGGSW